MFRQVAAAAALTAAGLVVAGPLAEAGETTPTPNGTSDTGGNGNVQLLNGLDVLPVQACGLQVPILSGILQAPTGHCGVSNSGAGVNKP